MIEGESYLLALVLSPDSPPSLLANAAAAAPPSAVHAAVLAVVLAAVPTSEVVQGLSSGVSAASTMTPPLLATAAAAAAAASAATPPTKAEHGRLEGARSCQPGRAAAASKCGRRWIREFLRHSFQRREPLAAACKAPMWSLLASQVAGRSLADVHAHEQRY